jgi:hypothetical protein
VDTARDAGAAEPQNMADQQARRLDVDRAGAILEQVLDLAELLPQRPRGPLTYPSLARPAA